MKSISTIADCTPTYNDIVLWWN